MKPGTVIYNKLVEAECLYSYILRVLFNLPPIPVKQPLTTMSPSGSPEYDAGVCLAVEDDKPKIDDEVICQRIETSLSLSQSINPTGDFFKLYSGHIQLSQSNFYYADCGSIEAKKLLRSKGVGTFLIRDSSDPKFLYALSVKTDRGTTSIRILYEKCHFKMDSVAKLRKEMPAFNSVSELIEFYINLTKRDSKDLCRWTDGSGAENTTVKLQRPLLHSVPSLCHSSRLTINRSLSNKPYRGSVNDLKQLPPLLRRYLEEYPFNH